MKMGTVGKGRGKNVFVRAQVAYIPGDPDRDRLYDIITSIQDRFPIPASTTTVDIGTFDAGTGRFTWSIPEIDFTLPQPPFPVPPFPRTGRIRVAFAISVNVDLRFRITNHATNVQLVVNGAIFSAAPGQNAVVVPVARESNVEFSITSDGRNSSGIFTIERPPIIGAGTFIIPALPVAIVYAPPPGRQGKNQVTFTLTETIGIKSKLSLETENSTVTTKFDEINAIRAGIGDALGKIGSLVTAVAAGSSWGAYLTAASAALQLLLGAFGTTETGSEFGTKITNDHSIETKTSILDAFRTQFGEGPGVGDRMIFYRNVPALWLASDGDVTLAVLGTPDLVDIPVYLMVQDLVATGSSGGPSVGPNTQLDRETLLGLIQLNPLVGFRGNPNVPLRGGSLDAPRFRPADRNSIIEERDTPGRDLEVTASVTQTDARTVATTRVNTTHYRPGWLKFLGIGQQDDTTIKASVTLTPSEERSSGITLDTKLTVVAAADETIRIKSYYDGLFGTFAFVDLDAPNPASA